MQMKNSSVIQHIPSCSGVLHANGGPTWSTCRLSDRKHCSNGALEQSTQQRRWTDSMSDSDVKWKRLNRGKRWGLLEWVRDGESKREREMRCTAGALICFAQTSFSTLMNDKWKERALSYRSVWELNIRHTWMRVSLKKTQSARSGDVWNAIHVR